MNRDRIKQVADAIDLDDGMDGGRKFNMGVYLSEGDHEDNGPATLEAFQGHRCGTAGCIAGYTAALFAESWELEDYRGIDHLAEQKLGLSSYEAWRLFYAQSPLFREEHPEWDGALGSMPAKVAVRVLRRLADGEEL